jgi:hypothetical protein
MGAIRRRGRPAAGDTVPVVVADWLGGDELAAVVQ